MPSRIILGDHGERSIAPTVFALFDRAVRDRPDVAATLAGCAVRLEFDEDYAPVLVTFGDPVVVGDDDGSGEPDAQIRGSLPHISAVLTAPLAAGVPKPTDARGRAALARLADGRVALEGSLGVGRKVLRLLSLA